MDDTTEDDTTESGYQLYAPAMLNRAKLIHTLQSQRYTLREIREKSRVVSSFPVLPTLDFLLVGGSMSG